MSLTATFPPVPLFYNNGRSPNDPSCVRQPEPEGGVEIGAVSVLVAWNRYAIGFARVRHTVRSQTVSAWLCPCHHLREFSFGLIG